MPNFDAKIEIVPDSIVIEKYAAVRGWQLQFDTIAGDSLTNTHKWTFRDADNTSEVAFWFDLSFDLDAAVAYHFFDSVTAVPVAGTRDLIAALSLLDNKIRSASK